MKISTFCIRHPIIALVMNAMIVVIGIICFNKINVREYPEISVPIINIHAQYPNASAELIESSILNPLEESLAGVEGLDSMVSKARQGDCSIELRFREGVSSDRAMLNVKEAMNDARTNLPKNMNPPMIHRTNVSEGLPFIAVSVSSENLTVGELTHYTNLNLKNSFRSLKGVASAEVWGQPYTMEVKLDPKKMYAVGIDAHDVSQALAQSQDALPVGKFRNEVQTTLDLNLTTPEAFNQHPIKAVDGRIIHLKSIADTSLGIDEKQFRVRVNGKPGLILSISKTSDANPLDVADLVHKEVKKLQAGLPNDIHMDIMLDQTQFIKASLSNIQSSLIESLILVLIIVFFFLRSLSATFVPLITVPIALMGGVILMWALGYTLNVITLLAMVLAIGLVVDDAIVVLENIARHIEKGASTREAAIKGCQEIGFAIVAITLTLASVYIPIAFIDNAIGQLFVEFAVVLAGTVIFSGIIALTLSPVMCVALLKKPSQSHKKQSVFLDNVQRHYGQLLDRTFDWPKRIVGGCVLLLVATMLLYHFMPHEMAPKEDRSLLGVFIPPIPGKDQNTLEKHVIDVENRLKNLSEIKSTTTFMGPWGGSICYTLKDYGERKRTPADIVMAIYPELSQIPSIDVWPWSWDTGLPGLDDVMTGSDLMLAISSNDPFREIFTQVDSARQNIDKAALFNFVRQDLNLDTPGYRINLDHNILKKLDITPQQVAQTIEVFFSGQQYLHFQKDGISYPVLIQGKELPWTLNELYVINPQGKRLSVGTMAELEPISQPKELHHYNQMRSSYLIAGLHPGQTIEDMMPKLSALATQHLPSNFKQSWIGAAKASQESQSTLLLLLGMALIFIYAILTMQFESFLDPLIIMLTVPLALFGALLFGFTFGQTLNIFSQIALVTLIGLITKHGILIVEFTNQLIARGMPLIEAIKEAALLRLRPILMTTAAMLMGALPLIFSTGAGSEARRALGIFLVGGLFFGTSFTLLVFPKIVHLMKSAMSLKLKPSLNDLDAFPALHESPASSKANDYPLVSR